MYAIRTVLTTTVQYGVVVDLQPIPTVHTGTSTVCMAAIQVVSYNVYDRGYYFGFFNSRELDYDIKRSYPLACKLSLSRTTRVIIIMV
jgi:hypothetical protein